MRRRRLYAGQLSGCRFSGGGVRTVNERQGHHLYSCRFEEQVRRTYAEQYESF